MHRLVRCLVPMLLLLPACSDEPEGAPTSSPSTPQAPTPSASTSGSPEEQRSSFDPRRIELGTRVVSSGLESPIGLAHAGDGSELLYVIEQGGTIRSFDLSAGSAGSRLFLDISERITAGGEQGLLGLAFHPRFENNGRFFVNYTDLEGDTVVSEFHAPDRGDPSSERVLLRIDQPYANHNGGDINFGPDGYLYIATGDGGSAGDPHNNGQRLDTLLGKILRIDVDARTKGDYAIPSDNPFVGENEVLPEIWAYGLRNPWQFSFDRATEAMWIGDVGQSASEEIDRQAPGVGGINWGWRVVEGNACYVSDDCDKGDYGAPYATYSHDFGCSVTGGYVYRGERFPDLFGAYMTADYCSGNVWALPSDRGGTTDPAPALETEFGVAAFGEDEAGELYMTDANGGAVLQITARTKNG
jgi:glucose/arabinose dehydrogenase